MRPGTSTIGIGVPTAAGVELPIVPPLIGNVAHSDGAPQIQNWRRVMSSAMAACGARSVMKGSVVLAGGAITLAAVSVESAGSSDRRSSTENGRGVGDT